MIPGSRETSVRSESEPRWSLSPYRNTLQAAFTPETAYGLSQSPVRAQLRITIAAPSVLREDPNEDVPAVSKPTEALFRHPKKLKRFPLLLPKLYAGEGDPASRERTRELRRSSHALSFSAQRAFSSKPRHLSTRRDTEPGCFPELSFSTGGVAPLCPALVRESASKRRGYVKYFSPKAGRGPRITEAETGRELLTVKLKEFRKGAKAV